MRLLLLCALLGAFDGGADLPDGGAQVQLPARDPAEVKRLLDQERAKLNTIVDKQQSLLDALDAARAAATSAESAARDAEVAERKAKAALVKATAKADAAEAALAARIEALRPRLLARYRLDHGGASALLLSSASLSDLLWRKRILTRVLDSDLELTRAAKSERERLVAAKTEQAQATAQVKTRHDQLVQRMLEARHKRDELDALMKSLTAQRATKEKLVQELTDAAARLSSLAHSEEAFTAPIPFERLKGRLPYPAAGQVEVGFGKIVDAQFGTVLLQKGIDLRAPEGSPAVAIATGKVVHAAPLRGYGNLIIVDQGQGFFTLYAHLQGIEHAVGDIVNPGDRIGLVGDTGSLKGAYLYFEIRHHGTPLNPAEWLHR